MLAASCREYRSVTTYCDRRRPIRTRLRGVCKHNNGCDGINVWRVVNVWRELRCLELEAGLQILADAREVDSLGSFGH